MELHTEPTIWTEEEIGRYLAAISIDSKHAVLIGDRIRGFEPFVTITPNIHKAYTARRDDLERKRREYMKRQRKSIRASRRGLGAIDFNL
jgi:hypothetical protein